MSSASTISAAAAAIKETMTAAVVDPNATVESDRRSWIDAVANAALADGSDEHLEEIAGVPCRWVAPISGGDLAIIVYAHGGGLTAGSSVTHREFASRVPLNDHSTHHFPSRIRPVRNCYGWRLCARRLLA